MLGSPRLLQHACRITLFTRANCGLCDNAKQALSNVWDKRPFDFQEIDVMASGQTRWKELYEFDTPVRSSANKISPRNGVRKLMHRFSETDVEKIMNETEQSQSS